MRELLLNVGSFTDMFHSSEEVCILNIDVIDLEAWAAFNGYNFQRVDVKNGLPYPNGSIDIVLASHFLEHLTREEGAKFLAECHRVLKPDGLLRLAIPDARLLAQSYLDGRIMEFRHINIGVEKAPDSAEAFFHLLLAGHKTIYDYESLEGALVKAGFVYGDGGKPINRKAPFESSSKAVELQTISMYPTLSLYLEARKPKSFANFSNARNPPELASTHVEPKEAIPLANHAISKINQAINLTSLSATTHVVDKLRVALFSTPLLRVPPANYGGLEMVVADLGRGLAKLGHDVTIFAPNGSKVDGCRIVEVGEPANTVFMDWLRAEGDMFERVKDQLKDFDIIHGHNWFGMEYRAKALGLAKHVCHTHHGGILRDWWLKSQPPFKLNFIGISNWMQSVYEGQGIPTRAVHNGVDPEKYPLQKKKGDRFLFLSRIAFFKAPHQAIKIAHETGIKLDVAGATQFVEDAKYVEEIKKSCDGDQIRFIGEVSHEQKLELLSNAKALIVPALWGEPFGLHIIEAMMTGTQVLAVADGGIKETVKTGGVLCQDAYALKDEVLNFRPIAPQTCRRNAMLFSTQKMALNYESAYRDILAEREW